MQISREGLSRHYASLSDSELLSIDPDVLTEAARQCYQLEVERRNLVEEPAADDDEPAVDVFEDLPEDWLESAATACGFQIGSGRRYAEDAERACAALSDAGIPSHVVHEHDAHGGPDTLNVMVPGSLSLMAASILDRDLFNEELESTWRTHFEGMSDQEFRALHPDHLCAGLLDRAARLKRAYEEERARREG